MIDFPGEHNEVPNVSLKKNLFLSSSRGLPRHATSDPESLISTLDYASAGMRACELTLLQLLIDRLDRGLWTTSFNRS